jgi:hypothetical protein
MSPGARGASRERVPGAVLVEGGSVRGQLVLGEEGGGGLRHVHAHVHVHVHAHAHCDVWSGAAWADLLYSLLCLPLYRNVDAAI